jgi:hypothetical protein
MMSPCVLGQNDFILRANPIANADEIGKFRSILSIPGAVKRARPYE